MENIWFYSLSALSQVMAAIIALFSVFVVFKLQTINENISSLRRKAIANIASAVGHADSENWTNISFKNDNKLSICQADYLGRSDIEICKIFNQLWEREGISFSHTLVDEKNYSYHFYNKDNYKIFEESIKERESILNKLILSLVFFATSITVSLLLLSLPFSIGDFSYEEYNKFLLLPLVILSCCAISFVVWSIYSISKK